MNGNNGYTNGSSSSSATTPFLNHHLSSVEEKAKKTDAKPSSLTSHSPPRWFTLEFFLYYLTLIFILTWMFSIAHDLGKESSPQYAFFNHLLEPGWLFGLHIDNSDLQYSGFRNRIPLLLPLAAGHVVLGQILRGIDRKSKKWASLSSLIMSGIVLIVLHGTGVVKMAVLLVIPYSVTREFSTRGVKIAGVPVGVTLVWIYGILVLFANYKYEGYKYEWIWSGFKVLDNWSGLIPRWYVTFNFQVLHMISFSMDEYWSIQHFQHRRISTGDMELRDSKPKRPEAERISHHGLREDYDLIHFLDYCIYLPLYFAGPIVTYNDYMAQITHRTSPFTPYKITYAIRWAACLFLMECMQHLLYVTALGKAKAYADLTIFQFVTVGFFSLKFIWLKLLVIWRFFRLWALMDGIEVVENMERCMTNNYSPAGFWRSWHKSYYRWILRYIYIPMGGSSRRILNTFFTFTFVALWHDVSMQLFAWGWLVVAFMIPEILGGILTKKYIHEQWYRHLCGVGSAANILLMILVNLIGFSVGLEGASELVSGFVKRGWEGPIFLVCAIPSLFALTQVQFEVRAMEGRRARKAVTH
ncbi:glycerol transporter [Phlyctochytrium planicorne]|nr:glycerol transporter [Phlyctochytrium planicorne]